MRAEEKNQIIDDMSTTDIDHNNNIKYKLKKIIIPTIIIFLVWGITIVLIYILKITN